MTDKEFAIKSSLDDLKLFGLNGDTEFAVKSKSARATQIRAFQYKSTKRANW